MKNYIEVVHKFNWNFPRVWLMWDADMLTCANVEHTLVWTMSRKTFIELRKVKDREGKYLCQPSRYCGKSSSLLGFPVRFDENIPYEKVEIRFYPTDLAWDNSSWGNTMLEFFDIKDALEKNRGKNSVEAIGQKLLKVIEPLINLTLKDVGKKRSMPNFIESFNELATDVHENAVQHGWWEKDRNDGELIALMHSELSEALEALRNGNPKDDKLPEFLNVEVELADVIIRIMDAAKERGWRVAEAVVTKAEYNKTRPFKHGGKEF